MNETYFHIDYSSKIPIYKQISKLLTEKIDAGEFSKGDKLPTERELAESLNVSRGSIKSAFKKLSDDKIIEVIQGSGSYVLKGEGILRYSKKKEAIEILDNAISRLEVLGLSENEIQYIFNGSINFKKNNRLLNIAIIENNHEVLLDIRNQLSYLENTTFSIFILESITINPNPEGFLGNFDIIITSSIYYDKVISFLPNLREKIIEAAISPSSQTFVEISSLNRDSRIGIICRTNIFLKIIKRTLESLGFSQENILSFFEIDYSTKTYFPGGIDALISFNDAHIFTDINFKPRNEEFIKKGGKLIKFEYIIERGTLIYIENRVTSLLLRNQ